MTETFTASYKINGREYNLYFKAASFDNAESHVDALEATMLFCDLKLEGRLACSEPVQFQSQAQH
jgi:hypothetical protein